MPAHWFSSNSQRGKSTHHMILRQRKNKPEQKSQKSTMLGLQHSNKYTKRMWKWYIKINEATKNKVIFISQTDLTASPIDVKCVLKEQNSSISEHSAMPAVSSNMLLDVHGMMLSHIHSMHVWHIVLDRTGQYSTKILTYFF